MPLFYASNFFIEGLQMKRVLCVIMGLTFTLAGAFLFVLRTAEKSYDRNVGVHFLIFFWLIPLGLALVWIYGAKRLSLLMAVSLLVGFCAMCINPRVTEYVSDYFFSIAVPELRTTVDMRQCFHRRDYDAGVDAFCRIPPKSLRYVGACTTFEEEGVWRICQRVLNSFHGMPIEPLQRAALHLIKVSSREVEIDSDVFKKIVGDALQKSIEQEDTFPQFADLVFRHASDHGQSYWARYVIWEEGGHLLMKAYPDLTPEMQQVWANRFTCACATHPSMMLDLATHDDPEVRGAAGILMARAMDNVNTRNAILNNIRATLTVRNTSIVTDRQIATVILCDRERKHGLSYRISREVLRNFPVYDLDHQQIVTLNTQIRQMTKGLRRSSSIGSHAFDRLSRDIERDPLGTSFDLMFDRSEGSRLDQMNDEAEAAIKSIFQR